MRITRGLAQLKVISRVYSGKKDQHRSDLTNLSLRGVVHCEQSVGRTSQN